MNTKRYIGCKLLGLLAIATTTFTSCEREISEDAVLSTLEANGEVFIDAFSDNLEYYPYQFSVDTAFSVETNDENVYSGDASMRFDISDEGYSGAAFITDQGDNEVPRDLSGFDALTFWAKASVPVSLDQIGFGQDFNENSYQVQITELQLSTNWEKYTIAIPNASVLDEQLGMLWYSQLPEESVGGAFTFWLDEVQFEKTDAIVSSTSFIAGGEDIEICLFESQIYQVENVGFSTVLDDGSIQLASVGAGYVDYESSDSDVAVISEEGEVTVVGVGTAVITATSVGEAVAGSITITANEEVQDIGSSDYDASDVVSIYSDVYGNLEGVSFNQYWAPWQTTAGDDSLDFGFNLVSYTNYNFVGWDLSGGALDVSEMNTLHIDIFPICSTTNVGLEFQSDSGSPAYTITGLVEGEWNSLDISLSSFASNTVFDSETAYNWLVLNGGTGNVDGTIGETLLIDNVYFYDNGEEEEVTDTTELVSNGSFDSGTTGWSGNASNVQTDGGNSYNYASVATAGDAYAVNLSYGLEITAGVSYELTFDASTDSTTGTRTILAGIGLYEGPWTNVTETVTLTDTTQTFSYTLVGPATNTNSRIIFDMGADTGDVVIDNVSLIEVTE